MAVETGTATDHVDLLNKLVTFLTSTMTPVGERWVLEDSALVNGEQERYLRGPGLSGTDNIHVNIRTVTIPDWTVANWELQGATSFDNGQTFENQPGANPTSVVDNIRLAPTFFLTATTTINYTFIANGRRFIVIAQFRDFVVSMYAGFILPYASPAEYPYPLLIAGSSHLTRVSQYLIANISSVISTGSADVSGRDLIRAFFNPFAVNAQNGQSAYFYTHTNEWLTVRGKDIIQSRAPSGKTEVVASWPWTCIDRSLNSRVNFTPLNNKDGTYLLLPGILAWTLENVSTSSINATQLSNMMTYGEYDGVYFVSVKDLTSLDTFTIATEEYVVLKETFNNYFYSVAAVKKV